MRIDAIKIHNFRGIADLSLEFDPRFTLLVGDNGSGKTSILSAVSVALGIWHLSDILGDEEWRNIMDHEVREVPGLGENGEKQFVPAGRVQITAKGRIGESPPIEWRRGKRKRGAYTINEVINEDSEQAADAIEAVLKARAAKTQPLPLLAYYGAGRAWLPSNERALVDLDGDLRSRQSDGYNGCLKEHIRTKDVLKWFVLQAAARDGTGKFKPAYEAVCQALKQGIPGVDDIYWDATKAEVVVSIHGEAQPFSNLSDGQRTMASTIADMTIRAVSLNPHLLGDGNGHSHPEEVLKQTPGVVLIDEVDVHLHPDWQRSVVRDLTQTFPKVQFICSSHSPQVFGELPKEQIWVHSAKTGAWHHPSRSLGVDSSRILDEEMDAASANADHLKKKGELAAVIDKEDFPQAEVLIEELAQTVGEDDPDLTRARTLISFLQDTQ
jgi:predicted ATP-binding protein involved in virulence